MDENMEDSEGEKENIWNVILELVNNAVQLRKGVSKALKHDNPSHVIFVL